MKIKLKIKIKTKHYYYETECLPVRGISRISNNNKTITKKARPILVPKYSY